MAVLNTMLDARPQLPGLRLVLHAGAIKTGTTSLQFYLDRHRRDLALKGIVYPVEGTTETIEPKHQWIVHSLMTNDEHLFATRLSRCLDECSEKTNWIILSTEGIFNHWWDYCYDAKKWFGHLASKFDFCCVIWLREPISFFRSAYIQYLKNPRVGGIESYARDMSATEMLEIPWAARHLEYDALIEDMRVAMGTDNVFPLAYSRELIPEFCRLLGLDAPERPYSRENVTSLSSAGVEILRLLNRFALDHEHKRRGNELISEIDALIGDCAKPFELEPEVIRRIQAICTATTESLREMHESSLLRWNARYPRGKPAPI